MNQPARAMAGTRVESRTGGISEARRLYWSLLRELWEHQSIYLAPLAAAGVFFLGFAVRAFRLPARLQAAVGLEEQHKLLQEPYTFAALLIMGVTFVVSFFYCLDALYGERRDRSILFWKSLPVSDTTTVLSKASIPLVAIPLVTFGITIVLQSLMVLLHSLVLTGSGMGASILWNNVPLWPMWAMLLYHLLTIHSLWYAPIYAWLLLVSAWSRRMPILWAVLPLLIIGFLEKVAFNTTYLAALLHFRFLGGPKGDPFSSGSMQMHSTAQLAPWTFISNGGLWSGLLVAALFLAAAVWLRRERGPMGS